MRILSALIFFVAIKNVGFHLDDFLNCEKDVCLARVG